MRNTLMLLGTAALLVACQDSATVREGSSAGYRQLQGATLVLKQAIEVPAGKARVFLQDGGRVDRQSRITGSFDQYRPHCAFEIEAVDHGGFVIRPDTFRISRVQHSLQRVVRAVSPLRLAGLQLGMGLDGWGSTAYHEGYHFWLESAEQPAVRRLSCYGAYAEPSDLYPPTLVEIRRVLGGVAGIRM